MDIRTAVLAAVIGLGLTATVFSTGTSEAGPQSGVYQPPAAASDLPVTRVVLFSSGVGYFQRTGHVTGDEVVELTFEKSNVNDLLQSMVVSDSGGGRVLSVDYSTQDPLARALQSFPIDLSDAPGVATLLARARGARVSLRAPTPASGVILGIEQRPAAGGDVQHPYLNLLTSDGTIRSVDLTTVEGVHFQEARLQDSLSAALSLIAANRNTDTKRFAIRFSGNGVRPVSLSYIIGTPVWKTSYRLSVTTGAPSFLQGWAIVDNPTNDDWTKVKLDLVSGQPISFQMDLSRPVYAQRAVVPVPLPPTVGPQTYESGIGAAPSEATTGARPPSMQRSEAPAPRAAAKSGAGLGARAAPSLQAPPGFALSQGVESVASAAQAGQFFQYSIKTPVTLPRHQSAMVPIVNQEIEGTPVAIYNESVLRSHPLSGLELKNTTGLHLMAGPITVFEDGIYAGDAEIADLPPGGSRLISYAVDLKTTVVPSGSSSPEEITSGHIVRGNLIVTRKYERERQYDVVTTDSSPRRVLVEYPISAGWKLVSPEKPKEKTADLYRFEITTDPAKKGPATLMIREERTISRSVILSNLDSRTILFYVGQKEISPAVKDALGRLNVLKQELADLNAQRRTTQSGISSITKDQERIRANMRVLKADSALYKRYAETLSTQEDQLTAAQAKIEELTQHIDAAQKRIQDFLGALSDIE